METVQIYHAPVTPTVKHVVDPNLGLTVQTVYGVTPSTVTSITYGATGEEFGVQPDGCFYVPREVADFYLRMPDWHAGSNPFVNEDEDDAPRPRPRRSATR
jgi:hypothetical protein